MACRPTDCASAAAKARCTGWRQKATISRAEGGRTACACSAAPICGRIRACPISGAFPLDAQTLLADPMLVFQACVSHRSQIGSSQTVHTKDQRDFAAVMQIVFHHMVDHPTARYLVHLTVPFIREGSGAVARCPALHAGFDECPRLIEAAYQFHRAACWGITLAPRHVLVHRFVVILEVPLNHPALTEMMCCTI